MEIVIELVTQSQMAFDDDFGKEVQIVCGNRDVVVDPMGQTCRGRFVKSQQHEDQQGTKEFKQVPEVLPGYHVSLDLRARRVTVSDPLYGTAKGQDLERRFDGIGKSLRLKRPFPFDGLGEQQLWVWLKWMFRTVRDNNAELLSGEFPKAVAHRVEQERQWDLQADPNTGKRPWEPEPSLDDNHSGPKQPSKAA